MIYSAQEIARVRNLLLLTSLAAWSLLVVDAGWMRPLTHCQPTSSGAMPIAASLQMLLAMNPPASLAAGWALMLVAMMSPVLIPPVLHIRLRSFTHRRVRSIALFLAGYTGIWMATGGVLLGIELLVKVFAPQSYLPAAGVVLIAVTWQFSPIKQRCLNRCHAHSELAAFGVAADFDALRFGITHGSWCAASCWALMLFPILLPRGHVAAMAAVAILILSERLEAPGPPRWRVRGAEKAIRIVLAQARMRLHALQLSAPRY